MDHGSTKPHLQVLALRIYNFSVVNNVVIEMEWIPREDNMIGSAGMSIRMIGR